MSLPWRSVKKEGGLVLLILAATCSAPLVRAVGVTVTGDRILGVVALLAVGIVTLRGQLHWTSVHSALAAFTGIQVLTSVLAASSWPPGPKFSMMYVLGFGCFALTAECARGREGVQRAAQLWIAIGAVWGLAGTFLSVLANVWQTTMWGTGPSGFLEIQQNVHVRPFAAMVTFNEWNLYSSFLLVAFALSLWTWRPDAADRRLGWGNGWVAVSGIALGLVFGLTRAAWISMAGLGIFWLWACRPTRRQIGALGLIVVSGLVLQAMAMGGSPLYYRIIKPVEAGKDTNMIGRFIISEATVKSSFGAAILGRGAGSTNALELSNPTLLAPNVKPWNGNLVLFLLHDSGMIGLASFVGLVTVVGVKARDALRTAEQGALRSVLVALLAAGITLLFAYQFTHGLWLMYPYVYLGLVAAAIRAASDTPAAYPGSSVRSIPAGRQTLFEQK